MPKKKKKYPKKEKKYYNEKVFIFYVFVLIFIIIFWIAINLIQSENKIIKDEVDTEVPISEPSVEEDKEEEVTVDQEVESSHNICEDGKCVSTEGSGSNECNVDSDCIHKMCSDQQCITVNIPGDNQCSTDLDCECVCDSGLCCDGCYYRPSNHICEPQFEKDFGCPWGTECGSNTAVRYKVRYCPGDSTRCNGEISEWSEWSVFGECHERQLCIEGVPKCKYSPKCR
ncbi:MAG: hypothetical protein JSW73_05335 [Candidatus Woesearchaeota archaeon]|nr:MAG: hypothetical protein JSW73_05335 [Candidatus Woesearchaeota archaeon]